MGTLNQAIKEYTFNLQRGEIQLAYKGILEFIGKLRVYFIKAYPYCEIGGLYQGYMDMSYFPLSTEQLKDKGLKIAIVYVHDKGCFEVWLSAKNREISKRYTSIFLDKVFDEIDVFHDENNPDAIIECVLIKLPDFENQEVLRDTIAKGVEKFTLAVNSLLSA